MIVSSALLRFDFLGFVFRAAPGFKIPALEDRNDIGGGDVADVDALDV